MCKKYFLKYGVHVKVVSCVGKRGTWSYHRMSQRRIVHYCSTVSARVRSECDGTRIETRFHLLAKRTSPFKSAGASVQSTTGSRGVRMSGSNAGYTMFCGSVKDTGYPLHSPVSVHFPSRASPCAITFQLDSTVC